jgi:thiol-disulfide isomerase/thioredoxin
MKGKFIFIAGIVIAILVAGFFYNKYRIAPNVKFETLELTDINGNKVSLEKFKDQKLFINFFATWCGPCMSEMNSIENAQQILLPDNFGFILISDEPVEHLKNFQQQTQVLVLHSEKKLSQLDIVTIPTTYLLNKNHEIVLKETSAENWASEEIIDKLKELTR